MIELHDTNYQEILNNHFNEKKTVMVFITVPKCENCNIMRNNIIEFLNNQESNDYAFYYVDYTKTSLFQNYSGLYPLLEYPKTIVFYGSWADMEFLEGVISIETLKRIFST